jgi:hypothetical protein
MIMGWLGIIVMKYDDNHNKCRTTMMMTKSAISWDITPCSPSKINRRFGRPYRLHLQQSSACHLHSRWFLARLIFLPWIWRRYVPPNRRLTFNGLHDVISQKIVLFITTAVRTSNSTWWLWWWYQIFLQKHFGVVALSLNLHSQRKSHILHRMKWELCKLHLLQASYHLTLTYPPSKSEHSQQSNKK